MDPVAPNNHPNVPRYGNDRSSRLGTPSKNEVDRIGVSLPRRLFGAISALVLAAMIGCAAPQENVSLGPEPAEVAEVDAAESEAIAAAVEEEVPIEERWRSPFAVSSAGRVGPRGTRRVVILDADPEIAEALAERDDPGGIILFDDPPAANGGGRTVTAGAGSSPAGSAPEQTEIEEPEETPERVAPTADDGNRASSDNVVIHHVRRGETWSDIARLYDVAMTAMLEANPEVDPLHLTVGQPLRIPVSD